MTPPKKTKIHHSPVKLSSILLIETGAGIEPAHRGFADPGVSTSPSGQ